jgi:hypothetical protein
MRRTRAIRTLMATACVLAAAAAMGCANPGGGEGDYYRRGTVHNESFPPNYVPGRHRTYGYGRHGW